MALTISPTDLERMLAHIRAEMPREACGLLAGVGGRVMGVYQIPNVADDPCVSFRMDAQAQVNALLDIETREWDLLAIYHSHPHGTRMTPSPLDIERAYYPEALIVIVAPDGRARAFSVQGGEVDPVPLHVV